MAVGALLLPYGGLVLLVRLRVVGPLLRASESAAWIGPQFPGTRISMSGIPSEVVGLVRAVNGAVERLEQALSAQHRFDDAPGGGSVFTLILPLAEATSDPDRP